MPPADGGAGPDDLAALPTGDLASACSGALVNAGPAAAVPVNGVVRPDCGRLFVCRDANGLYALTSICPHERCDVDFNGSQFDCPCHASLFDFNGGLLKGPATRALHHFALSVDPTGTLNVDTSNLVAATTRTQG